MSPAREGSTAVTAGEAAVVCHQFGLPGGYAGSGFTTMLVELMAQADEENLTRLGWGYPGYAAAVRWAKGEDDDGVARLITLAQQVGRGAQGSPPWPADPVAYSQAGAALADVLVGVALCGHDQRVLDWLARCRAPVAEVMASLIGRARAAGALAGCSHQSVWMEAYAGDPTAPDPASGVPWRVIDPEQQRDVHGLRAYTILGACGGCAARVVSVRTWDATGPGPVWSSPWAPLRPDAATLTSACSGQTGSHPTDAAPGYCGACHDGTAVPGAAPEQAAS